MIEKLTFLIQFSLYRGDHRKVSLPHPCGTSFLAFVSLGVDLARFKHFLVVALSFLSFDDAKVRPFSRCHQLFHRFFDGKPFFY